MDCGKSAKMDKKEENFYILKET